MSEACAILNDIRIDIMDYIKPAYCNEAQVIAFWVFVRCFCYTFTHLFLRDIVPEYVDRV